MNPDEELFEYKKKWYSMLIWGLENTKRYCLRKPLLPKSKIGKKCLKLYGTEITNFYKPEISVLKQVIKNIDKLNQKEKIAQFTAKFGEPTGHIKKV